MTCDIALARAAVNPATDGKGNPITSIYKIPVNWRLPDDAVEAKVATLNTGIEAQVTINEDGRGVSCRTISRVGGAPDVCANFKPGLRASRSYVRDGRKV